MQRSFWAFPLALGNLPLDLIFIYKDFFFLEIFIIIMPTGIPTMKPEKNITANSLSILGKEIICFSK
jgi:hypothetical protein